MRLFKKRKVYHFNNNLEKLEVIGKRIVLKKRGQQGRLLFKQLYQNKKKSLKQVSKFIVCAKRFLPPIINNPSNEI
tara:strand:- start:50 stop:277 length:228 start_codon:yes stop_codon:yes gene_type:complete